MNKNSTLEKSKRYNKLSDITLVTISGLDGSGKSTQIKFLKKYLESQGKKVYYFHAISFSLPNKILGIFKNSIENKDDTEERSITKSSWPGIQLRKIFLPIDLWRFEKLCKKLKKESYNYILSDRYFYDSVVNIEYLSGKKLRFIPKIKKPDTSIYLQTDPEAIMTRSKRVPDQGLDFLKAKKKILDEKEKDWNWIILNNTHKDKHETAEEIKKIVEEK
jgi:thymidylate kinase